MNTFDGYIRRNGTNSKVLLDGGNTKALSEFIGTISYANDKITYTKADGSASYDLVNLSTYNLVVATNDKLGGIKIGYLESGNNYAVLLDSSNKAYVSVPHYATSMYIGENNDTKANKAVNNPYFKLFDNNIRRSTLRFVAGTGIGIASDANGNITITNSSPDQNHNTDKTGIKLGTISGTKKTDSTVIINNSSTGLTIEGGTNKFSIGDGTNYIEVPVTPSFIVSNKDATIGTSLTTIATIAGIDIKAKIDNYLLLSGGTLIGELISKNGGIWIQGGSSAGGNAERMELVSGMPINLAFHTSKRGTRIYSNAIAFADPYNGNSNSDAGWIRHIEEKPNNGILEIAVGDDGNEEIRFRRYNTSSNIVSDVLVPNTTGTLALISQIPTNNNQLENGAGYLTSHYVTGLYIGTANNKSNAATNNGSTYLKLFDNDIRRNQFKIEGTQNILVSSDASGNITITGPDLSGLAVTSNYYTKSEIDNKLSSILEIKIVTALPTSNINTQAIYLMSSTNTGTNDLYKEYVYINKGTESSPNWDWETLGEVKLNYSNLVTNIGIANLQLTWTKGSTAQTPINIDAKTLLGMRLNSTYGGILCVRDDGVMEAGRYLDFHTSSDDSRDFAVRLQASNTTGIYNQILPSKSGIIALTSDLSNYLPLSGGVISNGNWGSQLTLKRDGGTPSLYFDDGTYKYAIYPKRGTNVFGLYFRSNTSGKDISKNFAFIDDIPTKTSLLTNDSGYLVDAIRTYPGTDVDPSSTHSYWAAMTQKSGITNNWWHILHMDWTGGANWRSELALPTQGRKGVYYRTDSGDGTNWTFNNWIKLLDTSNSYISNGTITINGTSITPLTSHQSLSNYLPLSGGSLSGNLYFTQNGSDTYTVAAIFAKKDTGLIVETPRLTNASDAQILPFYVHTRGELLAPMYAANIYSNNNLVWHAGNDGSGSGLDADTLDGYHETSFYHVKTEFGGRNYFKQSTGCSGQTKDSSINGYVTNSSTSATNFRIQNLGFNSWRGDWTVSFEIKADSAISVYVNLCGVEANSDYNESSRINVTTSYVKHKFTFIDVHQYYTPSNYNGFLDIESSTAGVKIYIKDIKIEKGVVATDWTPAPEDLINTSNIGSQSVNYATSASKLTIDAGSATQPVYFSNGVPTTCTYQLNKTVPSNAVFTDMHVTQRLIANNGNYPILSSAESITNTATDVTNIVCRNNSIYVNPSTGTITANKFNGSSTHAETSSQSGFVKNHGNNLEHYWMKLWEIDVNARYMDRDVTFLLQSAFLERQGTLHVRIRQNGNGSTSGWDFNTSMRLTSGNIIKNRVRLYYNNSTGNVQLWYDCEVQYGCVNAKMLHKTLRYSNEVSTLGTMYSTATAEQQTLPGTGYEYIEPTYAVYTEWNGIQNKPLSYPVQLKQDISTNVNYPLVWTTSADDLNGPQSALYKSFDKLLYNPSRSWLRSGTLELYPGDNNNYSEGLRIHSATDGWTTLAFCGSDNTGTSGTSANSWQLHTYDGNFYINRNSADGATVNRLWGHSNGYTIGHTTESGYNFTVGGTSRFIGTTTTSHILPASGYPYNIGSSAAEYGSTFSRAVFARHLNASGPYSADKDLYLGYQSTTNILFYVTDSAGNNRKRVAYFKQNGNATFDYTVTAASFYSSSDIRLKNVIFNPIYKAEDFANLDLVKYTWKDKDNKVYLGSIAQSVEKKFPELISTNQDGYKSLDYSTLGTIGVISLAKEIIKLKEEIKELKSKLYG